VACSIAIESQTGIAIGTCTGGLGLKDAEEDIEALWKHPDWQGRAVVWDFRSARFDFEIPDIHELAAFVLGHQPASPPSRVAFVTARDVDFGMARMFEVFREDPATEFRVFRDYHEAVAWARALEPGTT
jgi:hypothetical protein